MRFYNHQHPYDCGIDLHVKTMYLCILDTTGQVLVHRNVPSTPAAFLETVAPYRADLVVAAECMFTWYWLADLCAAEHITFVLGHALAMKAIHGGKAKNDEIDSHQIAVLLRGGLLPEGSEPGYNRPVLIIQSDAFNRSRLHTVIAVVLSTNLRLVDAPGNVLIPAKASGLRRDSVANVSQVITIDREFLIELAGRVRGQFLKDVENGLRLVLGL